MKSLIKKALIIIMLSTSASIVHSQEIKNDALEIDTDWQFRLSPYIWAAGVKGDMATIPGLPSAPIDISATDAIRDTEISLMVLFEAKYKKQGFLVDVMYSDIRSNEELPQGLGLTLFAKSKTTILSAAYLHEIYNDKGTVIDAFTGIRYWNMNNTLDVFKINSEDSSILTVNSSESWVDPLVGVQARKNINNSPLYIAGTVALGGFGVGSEMFYDASFNVGYNWNKSIGTSLGYRVYDLDYDNNDFKYNAVQQGWVLGLTWDFL